MTETSDPKIRHKIPVRLFEPASAALPSRPKILLLKLDHIGDFIAAIEAFRIIRRSFADAEITLICLPAVVALAEGTGLFDKVKGFKAVAESASLGKLPGMYDEDRQVQLQSLLEGPYFLAADFKHDPYNRFGLDHVEARYRAGFSGPSHKGLDIVLPTMEWDVPVTNTKTGKNLPVHSEVRLKLLAYAIVESLCEPFREKDILTPVLDLPDDSNWVRLKNEKRLKIGVSLGAGSELRQWKSDYWVTLLLKLIEIRQAHIIFFGGETDRAETETVYKELPFGSFTDLTGRLPLPHVPVFMAQLDVYIGCDTGLTHLAGNLGLPTVNIFAGISNISVWRARGPKVKTVYAEVVCAPCHLRFKSECPNNNICMGALVPDIVYACFEQLVTA